MGQLADSSHFGDTPEAHDSPVDLVHLARHTFGDAELEREVLQLFVTQSRIYLNRLKESRDVEQWRRSAHTIKGSARGIGAWAVHEASGMAEQMQGEKRLSEGFAAIGMLEAAVNETDAMIAQFLNE